MNKNGRLHITQTSPVFELGAKNNLLAFFGAITLLAAIRVALGFAVFPVGLLGALNVGLEVLYLGLPVIAIYRASDAPWSPRWALAFLVGGIMVQAGSIAFDHFVLRQHGFASGLISALSQIGLQTWCVGLGALLATLIREKNILIPIALFLALYDMFLVLTPVGPTQQLLKNAPAILQNAGMSIPKASATPTGGKAAVVAYVGPADLVFLGAFFVALFRFGMRTRETLVAMVPTLLGYMVVVLVFGVSLPALLPIGAVILIVNRKEFQLSKDEKLSTALITIMGVSLLVYGMTHSRPKLPPEPSKTDHGPVLQKSAETPGKVDPSQPRSPNPRTPADKPNLP